MPRFAFWCYTVPLRLRSLFRRSRVEQDLDNEMAFHLAMQVEAEMARGLSEDEARAAALRRFGGTAQRQEECRDTRKTRWIEDAAQDLRYAVRTLRRNPGFAAAVVLTLALGIGANSAVFSVLNAVMLRSLPVERPEELFLVQEQPPVFDQRFSYPLFEQLRNAMPHGQMAAVSRVARMQARMGSAAQAETMLTQLVSGEFFTLLGTRMALGRPLTPEDNRTVGAHPVAVVSHRFWQGRLGGSPDVLGRTLTIKGVPFTIVGVGPAGFDGLWLETPADAWVPLMMQHEVRYANTYNAGPGSNVGEPWLRQEQIGWLDFIVRPSAAPGGAAATLTGVLLPTVRREAERARTAEERQRHLSRRLVLEPFAHGFSDLRKRFGKPLWVLMGMAAMVLLIACANTANLLLARAAAREREMAVRLSIGAGGFRLVRQLLTESLLFAVLAMGAALGIAHLAGGWLVNLAAGNGPQSVAIPAGLDGRVLLFTTLAALATALLFGLVPALRAARVDLAEGLKTGGRGASGGARSRLPRVLVVSQVALSLLLVAGTGLLARSLQGLLHQDLGYRTEHVLSVAIDPDAAGLPPAQLPALYDRVLAAVRAVPGVDRAAVSLCGLAGGCGWFTMLGVEGYQPRPGERRDPVQMTTASPEYLATVGLHLLAGRGLEERDRVGAPKAALVTQSFVRRYFADGRALGKRIQYDETPTTIVGVIADIKLSNLKEKAGPLVIFPLAQMAMFPASSIEVRTAGDPRAIAASVRRAILQAEPNLPVERVTPLADRVNASLGQEWLVLSLTACFGALALLLAGYGLFGLLSYAVVRRTPEFGIRMALGAGRAQVLGGVLREALLLTAAGLAMGLPLVLVSSRLLGSVLHGVTGHDAATLGGAGLVMALVAALAGLLPAWRASQVNPMLALRQD